MEKNKTYTIGEIRRIADNNEICVTRSGYVYVKEKDKKRYIQRQGKAEWIRKLEASNVA